MSRIEGLEVKPNLERVASATFGLTGQREQFLGLVRGMGVDEEKLAGIMEKNGDQIILEIGDVFLYHKTELLKETYKFIDSNEALTPEQREKAKAFARNEKLWESLTNSITPVVERAKNRMGGKENESGQESAISRLAEALKPRSAKLVADNGLVIEQFSFGGGDWSGEESGNKTERIIGGGALLVAAAVFGYISLNGVVTGMNAVEPGLGWATALAFTATELGLLVNTRLGNPLAKTKSEKVLLVSLLVGTFGLDALATFVSFGGFNGLSQESMSLGVQLALRGIGAPLAAVTPELFSIWGLQLLGVGGKKKSDSREDISFQMKEPEEESAPTQNRKGQSFFKKLRDEIASGKKMGQGEETPAVNEKLPPTIWRNRDSANQGKAEKPARTQPVTARNRGSWSAPASAQVNPAFLQEEEGIDQQVVLEIAREERKRKNDENRQKIEQAVAAHGTTELGRESQQQQTPPINLSTGFGTDDRKVNSYWTGLIDGRIKENADREGVDYNAVLGYIVTQRNQLLAITDLNSRAAAGEKIADIINSQN